MYALDNPSSTEWTLVGKLWTESPFTQSLFADELLNFQRSKLDRDITWLKENGTWNDNWLLDVPRFDFDKYGMWNKAYKVAMPTDERVMQDLEDEGGCPFDWVVEYMADFNEKSEERMVETEKFLEEFFEFEFDM